MAKRRDNRFKEFARAFGTAVTEKAKQKLAEVAAEVVVDAKSRCPITVDGANSNSPGALRDSIVATPNRDGTWIRIMAGATNPKTGMPYGQYVEFDPRIKKPFMYPAMDAHAAELKEGIITAIQEAVKANAQS